MTDRNAHLRKSLGSELFDKVQKSKVLVVGAGGIGCELLKNLVLTGFRDIETIDLDTIDISNLNRQFLFRVRHVGSSKAMIAREAVMAFNPEAKVVAHHGNIKDPKYGVEFFKKFDLVMNALDNLDARRHVNRVCLSVGKPLIESGTQGYAGQVTTIRHGETECFECQPHPAPKTFPACTLRDTPDQPVHCVVWAKSLYSALFGPPDEENMMRDLKIQITKGAEHKYARELFEAFFTTRIQKQLEQKKSEGKDWKPREPPVPLFLDKLLAEAKRTERKEDAIAREQRVLATCEYARMFVDAVDRVVKDRAAELGTLTFDKDDEHAMDFVTAAANVRMGNFAILQQSKFQTKGIAGNIVHAIATTNAVAAGLIVVEALKVIGGQPKQCRTTWIRRAKPYVLTPEALGAPNKSCYICSAAKGVTVTVNVHTFTLRQLFAKVLRKQLGFVEPSVDVTSADNYIGVEGDQDDDYLSRPLAKASINDCALLSVTDDAQDTTCDIKIVHEEKIDEEKYPEGFIFVGRIEGGGADGGSDGDEGGDSDADMASEPPAKPAAVQRNGGGSSSASRDGSAGAAAPATRGNGSGSSSAKRARDSPDRDDSGRSSADPRELKKQKISATASVPAGKGAGSGSGAGAGVGGAGGKAAAAAVDDDGDAVIEIE